MCALGEGKQTKKNHSKKEESPERMNTPKSPKEGGSARSSARASTKRIVRTSFKRLIDGKQGQLLAEAECEA
jgi:hypothetical protein